MDWQAAQQELLERARASQSRVFATSRVQDVEPGSPDDVIDAPESMAVAPGATPRNAGMQRAAPVYTGQGDKFAKKRQKDFLFWIVIPTVGFVLVFWYLLVGQYQKPSQATPTAVKTGLAPAFGTPGAGGAQSVFALNGNGAQSPLAFGGGESQPRGTATKVVVKCYARIDASGVFTSTLILRDTLFIVEGYTRANGGMIYNSKFDWMASSSFGCQGDVLALEREFVPPTPRPTATGTRRLVTAIPKTATPLPQPTATLTSGLILFRATSCDSVTWLAHDVAAVYLTVNGKREGVAGENAGQPIVLSICPISGTTTIKLDVVLRNGQVESRGNVLQ